VQRFNPLTFEDGPVKEYPVGANPAGLSAGAGGIWVTSRDSDHVMRLDAAGIGVSSGRPIAVGDGPTVVAMGDGAVWVANTAAGSVSRIDPTTNEVTKTIPVGNVLAGLAVAEGMVWASVQAP
jgi:YVTN family beta-propeller protein